MVDAGGISVSVSLEPFEDIAIQSHCDQLLGFGADSSGELGVSEGGNIRVVDFGVGQSFQPVQCFFLGCRARFIEDIFGSLARQLFSPR